MACYKMHKLKLLECIADNPLKYMQTIHAAAWVGQMKKYSLCFFLFLFDVVDFRLLYCKTIKMKNHKI